jgi:two-component system, LytTR family, response regulator
MSAVKKVIVCDDEDDARLLIQQYIAGYPQLQVVKECSNGLEAVTAIDALEPDLIFLDIQMPGLSGFQVLQQIVHVPQIIFSTAFDKYALKAFDNNAVDYLLKPYTKERFSQAVNKVLLNSQRNMESIKNLGEHLQAGYSAYPEKVLVDYMDGSRGRLYQTAHGTKSLFEQLWYWHAGAKAEPGSFRPYSPLSHHQY